MFVCACRAWRRREKERRPAGSHDWQIHGPAGGLPFFPPADRARGLAPVPRHARRGCVLVVSAGQNVVWPCLSADQAPRPPFFPHPALIIPHNATPPTQHRRRQSRLPCPTRPPLLSEQLHVIVVSSPTTTAGGRTRIIGTLTRGREGGRGGTEDLFGPAFLVVPLSSPFMAQTVGRRREQ